MIGRLLDRRPQGADEHGFTLIELMMTMTLGLIILGSATLITMGAERHNVEVANRVDATQRGRLAMDRMQRALRSQVCVVTDDDPIAAADAQTVTVYSDLSDGSRPIERHTYTFDPGTRRITDTVTKAGPGDTFTTPSSTRVLATDVEAPASGKVLRFFAYPATPPSSGPLQPDVELVTPLSTSDLGRISRVDISFLTTGATGRTRKIRAPMNDQVFVRLARPNDTTVPNPVYNPTCA